MTTARRHLRLVAIFSCPALSWRHPDGEAAGDLDIDLCKRMARTAERGKLDGIFLGDSYGIKDDGAGLEGMQASGSALIFEPITLLSALAMETEHIGLAATVSASYSHPFTIARQLASLDHLSRGRAGWNMVTSAFEAEALNYGLEARASNTDRYGRAREYLEVVTGLWDGWEDGAVIRDRASGRYFDAGKVHRLNFSGDHFRVRGPLNLPRSPQGRPVMFQAGTSEAGYDLAAEFADAMYVKAPTLEAGQAFYRRIKGKLPALGREPEDLAIMPGLTVVVGTSARDARDKLMASVETLRPHEGLRMFSQLLGGVDISDHPLDEPIPSLPSIDEAMAKARMVFERNGRRMTIREVIAGLAINLGHLLITGTPGEVADELIRWQDERGADGFVLMPYLLSRGLEEFVDRVIPELQQRGAFRTSYGGRTFRDHLGLGGPVRYPARSHGSGAELNHDR